MKKTLVTLMLLTLLVIAFACAAIADTPEPKTEKCTVCQEDRTFVFSRYEYSFGNYHSIRYKCSVCGQESFSAKMEVCSVSQYTYNNDATCEADGTKTGMCDMCEHEFTVAAEGTKGHSFTDKNSGNIAQPATCTDSATYYVKCDNCEEVSDTLTVSVGDPLGHSFTDKNSGNIAQPATCTDSATYYVKCDNCEEVSDTLTVSGGDPLGHSFTNKPSNVVVTPETCVEHERCYAQCDRCDAVSDTVIVTNPVGNFAPHTYTNNASDVVAEPATCTTPAMYYVRCDVCDFSYSDTDTVPVGKPLGHDYKHEGNMLICSRCGDKRSASHWFGDWEAIGNNCQQAQCLIPDCGMKYTISCDIFNCYSLMGNGDINTNTVCPVCGGSVLSKVDGAKLECTEGKLPKGDVIIRMGTLEDGTQVLTVGIEFGGKMAAFTGKVTVYLPEEAFTAEKITMIDEQGNETEVEFKVEDGFVVFELDFDSNAAMLLTIA